MPSIILTADDVTAKALVSTIKDAVNGDRKYAAYVAAHGVTRETVKDHAYALAVLTYPNDKPVQTFKDEEGNKFRTRFGNAVQKAGKGLRDALEPKKSTPSTALLTGLGKAAEVSDILAAWAEANDMSTDDAFAIVVALANVEMVAA